MTIDALVNNFATRSFRDVADGDYVAARLAYRAELVGQYLWASQQAIEKYLKCILLLNRIPAKNVKHDLRASLSKLDASSRLTLDLTKPTKEFIAYLDSYGRFRYLEVSNVAFGGSIVTLDQAVWELRRFCTLEAACHEVNLRHGLAAPRVRLAGGGLEEIIDHAEHPAREPLLWQNGFFGKRARKTVKIRGWVKATNSPLFLNPRILDEVMKYVYLPKEIEDGYRAHTKP